MCILSTPGPTAAAGAALNVDSRLKTRQAGTTVTTLQYITAHICATLVSPNYIHVILEVAGLSFLDTYSVGANGHPLEWVPTNAHASFETCGRLVNQFWEVIQYSVGTFCLNLCV